MVESQPEGSPPWLPIELPSGASGWLLIGLAIIAALGVAFAWWKKREAEGPPKPKPKSKAIAKPTVRSAREPDVYGDWDKFRKALPRPLRRALDDFQPVIILGNNASEKDQVALQLSGVPERQRTTSGKVLHRGEGLDVYLGLRSLVLVPTEPFLAAPGTEASPGWRKVLRAVSRTRAPRIVVCLPRAPIDNGDLAEITAWASTLRKHIDLVVAVRNEHVEVSVTLAEGPQVGAGEARLTAVLFELLYALSVHEGQSASLRLSLDGLSASLAPGSEERRQSAERWLSAELARYRRGWARLLGYPGQTASAVLRLSELFEQMPRLTGTLGAALAELFVIGERQRPRGYGKELCILPWRDGALLGSLGAFSGPRDDGGRWHPSRTLLHRLGVASGVSVLLVGLWLMYSHERAAWDAAATAALRYDPLDKTQELKVVRAYVQGGAQRRSFWLPEFFERDLLGCRVVGAMRKHLAGRIDQAVRALQAPENVLQLAALYLGGAAEDCAPESELAQPTHHAPSRIIDENIEQWRQITELSEEELSSYLTLACPITHMPVEAVRKAYGRAEPKRPEWPVVPNAAEFGAALQRLQGECELQPDEAVAIVRAEAFADSLGDIGSRHGAANAILQSLQEVETPVTRVLSTVFGHYEGRLQAIENLANEHEELELLARDVRPFAHAAGQERGSRYGSLAEYGELLGAYLAGEVPAGENSVVRMTFADNTFVIDRKKVRASLLARALRQLYESFTQAAEFNEVQRGTAEAIFFDPDRYEKLQVWIPAALVPRGLALRTNVPWRYTLEAFQSSVLAPLELVQRLLASQRCREPLPGSEDASMLESWSDFVQHRLDAYVSEYGGTWLDVYDSFRIVAQSDAELLEVLEVLSRPASPQLTLLREVLRQTTLTASDGSPFAQSLEVAQAPLSTLAPVLDEKALQDYRAILLELVNAAESSGEAAAAAPPSAPTGIEPELQAILSGASGFGRVVLAGLTDPKKDLRSRVHAWVSELGVSPALRGVWLAPVDAAYASGEVNLARNVARWWEGKRQELERAVLWRFPFMRGSSADALVADVATWLAPHEGRFFTEVRPVVDLLTQCGGQPCIELPPSLAETMARASAIARLFFDDKGEPKPIALHIEPMPFAAQRFAPKRASVELGDLRHEYFNTAPRGASLEVPWNDARVGRVQVELVAEAGVDGFALPIETESSPWALFRLLERAATRSGGRYRWELDVTGAGRMRGSVAVSYRVCKDVTLCQGLFTEALQWP